VLGRVLAIFESTLGPEYPRARASRGELAGHTLQSGSSAPHFRSLLTFREYRCRVARRG
jgi:hypothetical protein